MSEKKIGLVCNYYILNYGSALQCYATQRAVEELGESIEGISFPNIPTKKAKIKVFLALKVKQFFKPKAVLKKIQRIKNSNINDYYLQIRKKRELKFKEFIDGNILLTKPYDSIEEVKRDIDNYNIVMLGSDQLLNPRDIILGYHTLSFVPDNIKKISYAASFGLSKLPYLVRRKAKKELRRFDCFGAREIRGAEIYKELTGKDVPVVVDPTLLISREGWEGICDSEPIIKEKYIYCYFIGENPVHRKIAEKLKEYTGYKIVLIRHIDEYIESDEKFGDIAVNEAGPKEFINLIANAEYVLADSFHATIFSVIFQKKFFVLNRFKSGSSGSTNSRIDSLLEKLELEERRIESVAELNEEHKKNINYTDVNYKLEEWKKNSKNYLKDALEI